MDKILSYEEMNRQADILEAIYTCHNIVTQYAFEHSNACEESRFFDRKWSKGEHVTHVMPWGVTVTREANEYKLSRSDIVYRPEEFPYDVHLTHGGVFYHCITTRVIEVADDLRSCRISYLSPGHETAEERLEDGTTEYGKDWAWSKYGFDFIWEDGEWRILNMRVYPVFKCQKDAAWTDTPALELRHLQRRPGMLPGPALFQYTPQVVVPADEPEPPLPYKDLESTGKTEIGVGYAAVELKEVF